MDIGVLAGMSFFAMNFTSWLITALNYFPFLCVSSAGVACALDVANTTADRTIGAAALDR